MSYIVLSIFCFPNPLTLYPMKNEVSKMSFALYKMLSDATPTYQVIEYKLQELCVNIVISKNRNPWSREKRIQNKLKTNCSEKPN